MASRLRIAITYVTGLAAVLASGTIYGYGAWAPSVKAIFGWSQTETNLVGSVGDVGLYMGITVSLLCDLTSPRVAMLTGAVLQGLGYTLMALAVWKIFVLPSWGLMAFFVFLIGQGSYGTYVGGFNPSLFNFPNRWTGIIMSSMAASFALSSIIFTVVFKYVYRLPVVPPDPHLADSIGHYFVVLASTTFGVGLISAIFAVRLPLKASAKQDADTALNATGETPLRLFTYIEFWLIIVVNFFIAGSGLLQINNQGSIALSLGNGPAADSMVFILGFASVGGRLVSGFLSDLLAPRGVPRSVYLVFASILIIVGHTVFAFYQDQMMYANAALTGYAYGTLYSCTGTLLPILWGKKWMSTNNGLLALVAAAAGLISGAISGALYGRYANPDTQLCFGPRCYADTYIISGCTNVLSLIAAMILAFRTRRNVPLYDFQSALADVAPTQPLIQSDELAKK